MNSEPARRFRAELLARLDGLLSTDNVNVTLLAATNVPWYVLENNNIYIYIKEKKNISQ